jgi:hypothetical protein
VEQERRPADAMITRRILMLAVVGLVLTACSWNGAPTPAPAPRPKMVAGAGWAPEVTYLRAHPVRVPKNEQVGILVRSNSPSSWDADATGSSWTGVVVIPGGWTEDLFSDPGDIGMGSYVYPGDLFSFPEDNVTVDAPSDGAPNSNTAHLIQQQVVNIP